MSYIRKHKLYVRIPRRYKAPRTTDSTHDLPTYPNLVRELIPDRPNQVWSSDYMTPQEARECTGPLKKRWRSYREEATLKAQKDEESKELVTN